MGLEVNWYDPEHTILVATVAKDTTWADYHDSIDEIVTRAAAVNYRVDVIYLDDVGMPKGNPMPHIKQGVGRLLKQQNIRLCYVAGSKGSTGFVRIILETIGKVFSGKVFGGSKSQMPNMFTATVEEAVTCIHEDRMKQQESVISKT